ncbi:MULTISPECIES: ectoine/hydroxyectoine ABC transporter permease subunit EhuD [Dietzia]|uniref:Ectoine/hydroxyectoine ABC transporter permease subunit EhuD n=1 Tax=Dietzia psychralcaliphila TaxID=139021 RepID=A0AAD0NMQ7_9ACTN|nr:MULTISPECIES: ectoine/hydroxyectoine ABC transporter permease subunit EhuD [Dietzia]AWH94631.1 ectoine/hydroxyectoine ABC transporter permease subunit EhuD [Dietzia psychralcaliphila]MBB1041683.1 ectoine/hydroxyectoine ABC transporter permease subunit EhuD [Dietzia sp. Cai40]MBB1043979.1 ectoine/hydroxyectoine ABC transporter permease subunit EhuD [Dietzia sp. DQ11-44]PTM86075.1 amino acid ABC transporter membrane protein 2 (PAAT family) [Dietzia psychralcaliphila]
MIWDNAFAISIIPDLLRGLVTTVQITFAGMAIAAVLGLLVAVFRYLRIPVVSQILGFLVYFIRGTPLLVQAFFVFYVLPEYGVTMSALVTGIIVIGVNYSAYTAEVYRSGIEGIPVGQWEAATALNLPGGRTWTRIVLPQAVRRVVPLLGNYLIQMFKDSAILSAITVYELMSVAKAIGQSEFRYIEPFTIAALLYLVVSVPCTLVLRRLETRYGTVH